MDNTHGEKCNLCEHEHDKLEISSEKHDFDNPGKTTDQHSNSTDIQLDWIKYNNQFISIINNVFMSCEVLPQEAAEIFTTELACFLESKNDIMKEVNSHFRHKPLSSRKVDEAKLLKNKLEKKSKESNSSAADKSLACQALRHHNYILKERIKKDEAANIIEQEKAYKKNFDKFAKEVTNGTYGKPTVAPTFSHDHANMFYKERYSTAVTVDPSKLSWFPEVTVPVHIT